MGLETDEEEKPMDCNEPGSDSARMIQEHKRGDPEPFLQLR